MPLLPLLLVFGAASDTFTMNPVQRVALPYRYSITGWEIRNFPDKWRHMLDTLIWGVEKSDEEKRDDLYRYFDLGRELLTAEDALNRAMSAPNAGGVISSNRMSSASQTSGHRCETASKRRLRAPSAPPYGSRASARGNASSSLPSISGLAGPPVLLLTSPRDRIARQHEALMEPDVSLVVRERLEDTLMAEHDVAAISFQVGGLAAYPASVLDTMPLADTLRASAHEWVHHYMAFRPLGQKMFTSAEMVTLNETLADIVGREIGDRAEELLPERSAPPPRSNAPVPAPESGLHGRDEHFGFNEEMRETRLRVDELLEDGKVDEAEAYMEERRQFFVENGYPIRRLNQAYFAFHGTYAESAASSSPIAGQIHRFRELSPDLRTFVLRMADISSYPQFLERLEDLERDSVSVVP